MSATTDNTADITLIEWNQGMDDATGSRLADHAEKSAAEIIRHLRNGDREIQAVCKEAEKVHRLYLRGDKARLTLYFGPSGPLGSRGVAWQTAYGWIQAGRVLRVFSDTLKPIQEKDPIGVKVLAMYDRFTATPETQEAGREAITREAVAAATENRAAFSNNPASVASTIVAPAAVGDDAVPPTAEEAAKTREDTRIGKAATKHQQTAEDGFAAFQKALAEKGEWAAYLSTLKVGGVMGSASGAIIGLALDRIDTAHQAMVEKAIRDQQEAERADALKAAELTAAIDLLKPETAPTPDETPARSARGRAKAPAAR